ncbi:Uncharacterised protein [Mycobacteroides abscessus subsp. abscessus]|nr:Uncharacterised protein [Mycobacteroides abscessus subsp. abscessus]
MHDMNAVFGSSRASPFTNPTIAWLAGSSSGL